MAEERQQAMQARQEEADPRPEDEGPRAALADAPATDASPASARLGQPLVSLDAESLGGSPVHRSRPLTASSPDGLTSSEAAVTIQRAYRGWASRGRVEDDAAARIQARLRGYWVRRSAIARRIPTSPPPTPRPPPDEPPDDVAVRGVTFAPKAVAKTAGSDGSASDVSELSDAQWEAMIEFDAAHRLQALARGWILRRRMQRGGGAEGLVRPSPPREEARERRLRIGVNRPKALPAGSVAGAQPRGPVLMAARLLNLHPADLTTVERVVAAFDKQVSVLGASVDWRSEAGQALHRDLTAAKKTLSAEASDAEDYQDL